MAMERLGDLYLQAMANGVCRASGGKLRFVDEAAAHRALELARLRADRETHRREQRAYRCVDCADWHLTSLRVWVDE